MILEASALSELAAGCAQVDSREACGFLLGKSDSSGGKVTAIICSQVPEPVAGEFEISPSEIRRIRRHSKERGLEILALFHTHPSGNPAMSDSDRNALQHSEWPWVIVTWSASENRFTLTGYQTGAGEPFTVRCRRGPSERVNGSSAGSRRPS